MPSQAHAFFIFREVMTIEEDALQPEQDTQPSTDVQAPEEAGNESEPIEDGSQESTPVEDDSNQQTTEEQTSVTNDVYAPGSQPPPIDGEITYRVDEITLPNGTIFNFDYHMSLGDALIAAGLFLLVAFQVFKWLMSTVWGRRV